MNFVEATWSQLSILTDVTQFGEEDAREWQRCDRNQWNDLSKNAKTECPILFGGGFAEVRIDAHQHQIRATRHRWKQFTQNAAELKWQLLEKYSRYQ